MKTMIALSLLLLLFGCGQGPAGDKGEQGSPGTVGPSADLIAVQFCSGTPSYPSTFPEFGFCIDGNIYAVYSKNDGFLTLIPPGTYSSNAVGSACTFTVMPNCVIEH